MKNILKSIKPIWVLIPVLILCIITYVVLIILPYMKDAFTDRQAADNYENILNSSSVSEKLTSIPEKTASELEAVYEKNQNPDTLLLIISKYKEEESPDYEKIFNYYGKYFETADKKDVEQCKNSYVTTLYEAGQKEKYYEITNALLSDKNYMSEGLGIGEPIERPFINTVLLMTPIVNSSTSRIEDYNFAISKLTVFDIKDAKYLKEFERSYLLYSILCKLYYKTNNNIKSNFYKEKIISTWDKDFGKETGMKEIKDTILENLNQFILS